MSDRDPESAPVPQPPREPQFKRDHPYARDRTRPIERPPPAIAPQPEPATLLDLPREDATVRAVEQTIGRLLRVGVIASLLLLVIGSVLSFAGGGYGSAPADVGRLIDGSDRGPATPSAVLGGFARARGPAWIVVGLLVLLATPILRVAVSIVAFAIQRDAAFVVITSVVLALLALSFAIGLAHG